MNEVNQFKVLLYFDGSLHSLSAAVYTADLLNRIPNMHLTIMHVQESVTGVKPEDYNLMEIWSSDPNSDWKKSLLENKFGQESQYSKIVNTIYRIFLGREQNITQEIIFSNPNIPDIVKAITDYATKKHFELIIMGTRGPSSLKGLMYGSLAHSVLNKSDIPVLLIKKLPQEFVDHFCATPPRKSQRDKGRRNYLSLAKTM